MRAAIAAGADVNELDKAPDPRRNYGRPLHFASDASHVEFKYLKENLPVIKLLLEAGADPRLPGMMYTDSALEELKFYLKGALRDERFQPEWKEVIPFLREAYMLMKEVADRLDAREATAKEGLELQENKAAKEDSSIFSFGNDLVDGKLG